MLTKSEIADIRSLADKKGRSQQGLFIAEGEKLIAELLDSRWQVRALYYTEGKVSRSLIEKAERRGIAAVATAPSQMERISQLKSAAAAVATVEIPTHSLDPDELNNKLVIALDGVQDPGNLGTIIRTADWFGIEHIICSPDTADLFNPKVVQATMGAITRVKVHYTDLEAFLRAVDAPIYGTFLSGENIYRTTLSERGIIVMGNEGKGVSPAIEVLATHKLYIPPFPADAPTSESLNVAVATAIICSEFRRR